MRIPVPRRPLYLLTIVGVASSMAIGLAGPASAATATANATYATVATYPAVAPYLKLTMTAATAGPYKVNQVVPITLVTTNTSASPEGPTWTVVSATNGVTWGSGGQGGQSIAPNDGTMTTTLSYTVTQANVTAGKIGLTGYAYTNLNTNSTGSYMDYYTITTSDPAWRSAKATTALPQAGLRVTTAPAPIASINRRYVNVTITNTGTIALPTVSVAASGVGEAAAIASSWVSACAKTLAVKATTTCQFDFVEPAASTALARSTGVYEAGQNDLPFLFTAKGTIATGASTQNGKTSVISNAVANFPRAGTYPESGSLAFLQTPSDLVAHSIDGAGNIIGQLGLLVINPSDTAMNIVSVGGAVTGNSITEAFAATCINSAGTQVGSIPAGKAVYCTIPNVATNVFGNDALSFQAIFQTGTKVVSQTLTVDTDFTYYD